MRTRIEIEDYQKKDLTVINTHNFIIGAANILIAGIYKILKPDFRRRSKTAPLSGLKQYHTPYPMVS